ncbi:MAG: hypothetical protein V3S68_09810 [Dehalococcoidia bacterium]
MNRLISAGLTRLKKRATPAVLTYFADYPNVRPTMEIHKVSTWPIRPGLKYRRIRIRSAIAHLFNVADIRALAANAGAVPAPQANALCGARLEASNAPPEEGKSLVCMGCYMEALKLDPGVPCLECRDYSAHGVNPADCPTCDGNAVVASCP